MLTHTVHSFHTVLTVLTVSKVNIVHTVNIVNTVNTVIPVNTAYTVNSSNKNSRTVQFHILVLEEDPQTKTYTMLKLKQYHLPSLLQFLNSIQGM
jgi:hypothetical protein